MPDDGETLADALARCARGDRSALRAIFESEGPRLVAVAERIVRRRDLAEEVVQDAFIQIWTKAPQYSRERGSPRGWIYGIVRHRSIDVVRHRSWEDLTDETELARLQESDHADIAENIWMDLGARSRLRECLEQLDEAKRRCILMAYVCGYTHTEIAGRLRLPAGTAKTWIRRGLALLRECMQ